VSRADNLTTFICRLSKNSGSLKLLEPEGSAEACAGTVLACESYHIPPLQSTLKRSKEGITFLSSTNTEHVYEVGIYSQVLLLPVFDTLVDDLTLFIYDRAMNPTDGITLLGSKSITHISEGYHNSSSANIKHSHEGPHSSESYKYVNLQGCVPYLRLLLSDFSTRKSEVNYGWAVCYLGRKMWPWNPAFSAYFRFPLYGNF
jgi:hypothetical protein